MKQRINYLDLEILINEIRPEILNYRLQNIYDLASSSRQFLLKFGQPNSKKSIFVDPGFRIHLTNYSRSTAPTPSGFVAKLRKHLKTRRVTKISLAKANRTVVFSFSDDLSYHLVFEFFAGGNLLLLNKEQTILALQRVVSATDNHSRYAVGETYLVNDIISQQDSSTAHDDSPINMTALKNALEKASSGQSDDSETQDNSDERGSALDSEPRKKSRKKASSIALKKVLYLTFSEIASGIIETTLQAQGLDPNLGSKEFKNLTDQQVDKILIALKLAEKQSLELIAKDKVTGYIVAEKRKEDEELSKLSSTSYAADKSIDVQYVYEDFIPYPPNVPQAKLDSGAVTIITTETFNDCVDKYYSTIEAAKLSMKFSQQEMAAIRRLEAARTENQKRVDGLLQVQEKNELLGTALQLSASRVEEACDAVRSLVENAMDWTDIENLIKVEKQRQNPIAQMISLPLNLEKNCITLIVPNPNHAPEEESDSDSDFDSSDFDSDKEASPSDDDEDTPNVNGTNGKSSPSVLKVEVDLALSAFANARKYFDMKRTAQTKQAKTVSQADNALKRAEMKIKKDLKQSLEKGRSQQTDLQWVRNPFWFEKFYWFQSSDGYLCIGGRDYMQNEMLLQKMFKGNDIYVHSEVPGASVVIIKNHLNSPHIPPSTLTQAGAFCVASSTKAWDSKMTASAWWATRSQIPKISEHGDIVTTEFVVVNGEGKHYLPPSQLDMGLGFLWLIPDASVSKYPRRATGIPGGVTASESGLTTTFKSSEGSDDDEFPDAEILSDDEDFPDAEIDSDGDFEDDSSEGTPEVQPESNFTADLESEAEAKVSPEIESEPPQQAEREVDEPVELADDSKETQTEDQRSDEKAEERDTSVSDSDEDEVAPHILDIERELDQLKVGRRKVRDVPKKETKKSKKKKLLQAHAQAQAHSQGQDTDITSKFKPMDKARLKREEEARVKREAEIRKREKAKKAKEEQLKKILESEENDNDDNPDENMYPFASLVPKLVADDEPLAAVPVFAPWSALMKYKYKIKLQPGQTKKGKAVKEILHGFQNIKPYPTNDVDYPQAVELNAIRALKDSNVVLTLCVGKVKVSKVPGGPLKQSKTKGGSGKQKKK